MNKIVSIIHAPAMKIKIDPRSNATNTGINKYKMCEKLSPGQIWSPE